MAEAPASGMLFEMSVRDAQISIDELRTHPYGKVLELDPLYVSGRCPESEGNGFQVTPEAIFTESATVVAETAFNEGQGGDYPFRPPVRRDRSAMNTSYRQMDFMKKRLAGNPLWKNSIDMAQLNLVSGDRALLQSSYDEITGSSAEDSSMKQGVVFTTHGGGGSGGNFSTNGLKVTDKAIGASVNELVPLAD